MTVLIFEFELILESGQKNTSSWVKKCFQHSNLNKLESQDCWREKKWQTYMYNGKQLNFELAGRFKIKCFKEV